MEGVLWLTALSASPDCVLLLPDYPLGIRAEIFAGVSVRPSIASARSF